MGSRRTKTKKPSELQAWFPSPFILTLAGGVLLYAAFPPLNLWILAWSAPVAWLMLVDRPQWSGARSLAAIWAGSAIYWLAMLQGIRLAHWANNFGWLALSCYLASYLPLFILLTRVAVHQFRIHLIIAAPVTWTGLELARGHVITGFSLALLGHTQLPCIALIQIADTVGAYGVSFVVMWVAACLTRMFSRRAGRFCPTPLLPLAGILALVLGYGWYCLTAAQAISKAATRSLKVALLQGSVDKVFEYNPQRNIDTFLQYRNLALQARDLHPDLDLVVWPESAFTGDAPELLVDGEARPPRDSGLTAQEFGRRVRSASNLFGWKVRETAKLINGSRPTGKTQTRGIWQIVGTETVHFKNGENHAYNTVLCIDPQGQITDRYFKMHPVMFGEYIPFGDLLPWLYRLSPMSQGLTPGVSPRAFQVQGLRLSPSVCFESTVPHLIREHFVRLAQQGTPPDILVNVTDDGWFWGSSILDQQLACAVFRAIELRRPFLVAANTGLSAHIDGSGRMRERGPRRTTRILVTDVRADRRGSLYQVTGDLPACLCLGACLLLAVFGFAKHLRRNAGT